MKPDITFTNLNEIGGFFELELADNGICYHENALALNSARNSFEYILNIKKPSKVYIPSYICSSMLQPLDKLNIKFDFYNIDHKLEISEQILLKSNEEIIVYVNYFGVKSKYINAIAKKFNTSMVIDNSQAFFDYPIDGIDTIYSPRKFFGVPDGGYLYINEIAELDLKIDKSTNRIQHLIGRIEENASNYYIKYRESEKSISNNDIKKMSLITRKIMQSIDYNIVKTKRERNFFYLHNKLNNINNLNIDIDNINAPMVYPFLTDDIFLRNNLIKNNIYVATYWNEVFEREQASIFEKKFAKLLIPLPIDQRYGIHEMKKISKIITNRV